MHEEGFLFFEPGFRPPRFAGASVGLSVVSVGLSAPPNHILKSQPRLGM
jgi:hypothetical protein